MSEREVKDLSANGLFQNKPLRGKIEETHISWVILTPKYAFKLKKSIKLSFLDFSTQQLRKHFCEKEIELNSRFTDIYLDVVPVRRRNGSWFLGSGPGEIVDYAVRMKRLRTSKRMDNILQKGEVPSQYLTALADVISSFHSAANVIHSTFDLQEAYNTFNDILAIQDFVSKQLGNSFSEIIKEAVRWSDQFLTDHANRMQQRINRGFKRDVHGDLHCGNIFLYREPVLFDCIEFNDSYRQIDVLYEIAFLCMDLEVKRHQHLAEILLTKYKQNFLCFEVREDEDIFLYFKVLRANVRAKVHAMSAGQTHEQKNLNYHIEETKKYLALVKAYRGKFRKYD